jgi:carbon-monoxide dehydrogenase small subunit
MKLSMTVNGQETVNEVEARQLLGQVLRDAVGDDVRLNCETSTCGSCTVLLDGDPVKSCAVLAPMAAGAEITTASGLSPAGRAGEVLRVLEDFAVLPCGECRPALQIVIADLLSSDAQPSAEEIARAMSGTVCRCTGYTSVVEAVVTASSGQAL